MSASMRKYFTRTFIESGEATNRLDDFFKPKNHTSFREIYVACTGDKKITGRIENCDQFRMREALDTDSWSNALGAAITRRMLEDYRDNGRYGVWRKLVKIGPPINDFRNQIRVRIGGYGDLPIVAESFAYASLVSPPEESASFAVQKRGGTETITLEMIKNDDIGAIKLIPKRLAAAAQRTLAHFALDFLRTNPVIYDGLPFFHATHNNLGSAALSAASLAAAMVAIKHQTEPGSGEQLLTPSKLLAVPDDLEETAVNLFRRGTNNDKTYIQEKDLEVVPVWYWTDPNDWALAADPMDLPCIEVGFLDGQEEPQLFVQDNPSVGSLFTHDVITYKIRHIYGGTVTDYRGMFKSVVAA